MASVGNSVKVRIDIDTGQSASAAYGRTLLLENTAVVAATKQVEEKVRQARIYSSQQEVEDGGESLGVQAASRVYFASDYAPRDLIVGTQALAAQPSVFYSGEVDVTATEAHGDSYGMQIGDLAISADFDTLSDVDGIASALQTAINGNASIAGATVEAYESTRLKVTVPATIDVGDGFSAEAASLGLTASTGVQVLGRIAASETVADTLNRIETLESGFTVVTLTAGSYNDQAGLETGEQRAISIANWTEARNRHAVIEDVGNAALGIDEAASLSAKVFALGLNRAHTIYAGSVRDNKGAGYAALLSSINIDSGDGNLNLAFNDIPGTAPTELTPAQIAELDRKRTNYYLRVSDELRNTAQGWTAKQWGNTQYFADLLRHELQLAVYNAKKSARNLGWNASGIASLNVAMGDVFIRARNAGFITAGVVTNARRREIRDATNNQSFDGNLSKGFYIHFPQLNAGAGRATRTLAGVRFWAIGTESINSVDIAGKII